MKSNTKSPKSGVQRHRTSSGSTLGPREELLRESIRCQIACEPYAYWTKEEIWNEANRLATSLEKNVVIVRKAMYNRRSFINKKIELALIEFEVVDENSPTINKIAAMVQTIEVNVVHFLTTHLDKIIAEISAKQKS